MVFILFLLILKETKTFLGAPISVVGPRHCAHCAYWVRQPRTTGARGPIGKALNVTPMSQLNHRQPESLTLILALLLLNLQS